MGEFIAVCLYAAYMGLGLGVLFYVDNRWWKSVENLVGKSIVAVVVDWHLWPLTALFACLVSRAATREPTIRETIDWLIGQYGVFSQQGRQVDDPQAVKCDAAIKYLSRLEQLGCSQNKSTANPSEVTV